MRRFLFITGVLLPVIFLSACNNGMKVNDKFPILEFKSNVDIKSNDMQINANIMRDKDGLIQIEVISPETLKGLSFKHSETENSISRNDLEYKTDTVILPSSSVIASVIEILESMTNMTDEKPFYKDEKEMAFIGKIGNGKFELRADRNTGFITEIKIGEKITARFSQQSKL